MGRDSRSGGSARKPRRGWARRAQLAGLARQGAARRRRNAVTRAKGGAQGARCVRGWRRRGGVVAGGVVGREIVDTDDALGWLEGRPDITSLRAAVCDLNGILRGKRVPVVQVPKVLEGAMRMPYSITCLDIWGEDVKGNPLVFQQGDIDGRCEPTGRGFLPVNWLGSPTALLPLWMLNEDGHAVSRRPAAGAGGGLRAVCGAGADAGGGDRARVLPGGHDRRGADAAAVAGDAQVPRRGRGARRSTTSTISRRSSPTSTRRATRTGCRWTAPSRRTAAGSSRSTCCTSRIR